MQGANAMIRSMKAGGWAAVAGLLAVLTVPTASAALVTEWSYQVDSAFTSFEPASSDAGAVTGSDSNAYFDAPTVLSWGYGEGEQSSISVDGSVGGSVTTGGGFVPSAAFQHDNVSITDPNNVSLKSFTLSTNLQLTPVAPAGDPLNLLLVFDSLFLETANDGSCAASSSSDCDDIFVLTRLNGEEVTGTVVGDALQFVESFTLADVTYELLLRIEGLGSLPGDQCGAAGADAGCIGFLTQEGMPNDFTSSFAIRAVASVPEPGMLGLLGLGLAGLAFGRRQKRA